MPNGYDPATKKRGTKGSQREPIYNQSQFNDGQRLINGQLCYVVMTLVETLRLIRLKMAKFEPGAEQDFEEIDRLLKRAYYACGQVSSIKPPGCDPEYPPEAGWTITSTEL